MNDRTDEELKETGAEARIEVAKPQRTYCDCGKKMVYMNSSVEGLRYWCSRCQKETYLRNTRIDLNTGERTEVNYD